MAIPWGPEESRAAVYPAGGISQAQGNSYHTIPDAAHQLSQTDAGLTACPSLTITTTRPGPYTVRLHLAGEIDLATAPALRAALVDAVAAAALPAEVQVDLAEVAFIDAVGVGALVHGREAARRAAVGFSLHHACGITRRILEIFRLMKALNVTPAGPCPPGTITPAG